MSTKFTNRVKSLIYIFHFKRNIDSLLSHLWSFALSLCRSPLSVARSASNSFSSFARFSLIKSRNFISLHYDEIFITTFGVFDSRRHNYKKPWHFPFDIIIKLEHLLLDFVHNFLSLLFTAIPIFDIFHIVKLLKAIIYIIFKWTPFDCMKVRFDPF